MWVKFIPSSACVNHVFLRDPESWRVLTSMFWCSRWQALLGYFLSSMLEAVNKCVIDLNSWLMVSLPTFISHHNWSFHTTPQLSWLHNILLTAQAHIHQWDNIFIDISSWNSLLLDLCKTALHLRLYLHVIFSKWPAWTTQLKIANSHQSLVLYLASFSSYIDLWIRYLILYIFFVNCLSHRNEFFQEGNFYLFII